MTNKKPKTEFLRGDRVRDGKSRYSITGTFVGHEGSTRSVIAVPGGPSCRWQTKYLELVARPVGDGYMAYWKGEELGLAKDAAGVKELRVRRAMLDASGLVSAKTSEIPCEGEQRNSDVSAITTKSR